MPGKPCRGAGGACGTSRIANLYVPSQRCRQNGSRRSHVGSAVSNRPRSGRHILRKYQPCSPTGRPLTKLRQTELSRPGASLWSSRNCPCCMSLLRLGSPPALMSFCSSDPSTASSPIMTSGACSRIRLDPTAGTTRNGDARRPVGKRHHPSPLGPAFKRRPGLQASLTRWPVVLFLRLSSLSRPCAAAGPGSRTAHRSCSCRD